MSIFNIGISGLNVAQSALTTTSKNISNVYTPGYNREVTLLGEAKGNGGVQVNETQRQFDQFVSGQLNAATSQSRALAAYEGQLSQIDNLLADGDAGLAPLMQNFFAAVQDLTGAPSDPATRQGLLGAADMLTSQFRSFDGYLSDMQQGVNGQLRDEVSQINTLTGQVADLNREIALVRGRTGEIPNGLLNQRDHLVAKLSEHMDVRLSVQDGRSYSVTLPDGQPLVNGQKAYALEVVRSPNDPQREVIGYGGPGGKTQPLPETAIRGGTVGGLMAFRSEALDRVQNQLGQLTVSLGVAVNRLQGEGEDLNGDPGEPLFSVPSPRVNAYTGNRSGATATAEIDVDNIDQLRAADYTLRFGANGAVEIINKANGQRSSGQLSDGNTLSFGGVTLGFSQVPGSGDRFEVRPVRHAAGEFNNLISDLDRIVAGEPDGGSGDNRIALQMQRLQDEPIVGGNASLTQAYSGIVNEVGNRTSVVQANLEARQGITDQLRAVQQSESGVNLDEEAANLLRFQQFYAANARVIDTASTLFDTLLGLRN
ncbi:flagellar hook-associated protein FlgK [Halomonas mongoliensis]|uniref:flagellar hook-associated protein FlgK n=1 Tax=Halomonas mongoliensis TaxID=321265 RepID=UPI00403AAA81